LEPGDKILIYSDGLTEAQDLDGRFFDSVRLKELLRANAQSDFAGLHNVLMREVRSFTEDTVQNDDITAVVIEYIPS
jgi:sigma-B regulation protein RsbU (phosphoserine phosphatase)